MKICLVTSFPPSHGGLSEYGLHIAQELQRNPFLSLTILADKIDGGEPELPEFSVQRCWSFDDAASVGRIVKAIRELKPDVVWFNLLFSTFGRNPLVAFSGLMTPLLARLNGCYTHVTLHHLMDTVDLQDAGVRFARTYRLAGAVATRILLMSNSVSVLMPGYRKILAEKYGSDNVHVRSHGILTRRPEPPDFTRRGNPEHRILAFGKWGTYKRLELMIEAFDTIVRKVPNAKLVIAGGNHPNARGYVESLKEKWASNSRIEFTGYVHEEDLPNLFQTSSVAVMPYSSSAGCSGVAHLACAYGVPIVCADLPDFRQMAEGEELAMGFYKPGDAGDLANGLIRFLEDPVQQQAMAYQNFSAALRMTMPNIVQKYLRHFELQQRMQALKYVARVRRLPNWMPSKSLLLRAITRDSLSWFYRSALPRTPFNSRDGNGLLNGNGNGRGELHGSGTPVNGNGVGARSGSGLSRGAYTSAGNGNHANSDRSEDGHTAQQVAALQTAAPEAADEREAGYSDGQQEAGIERIPSALGMHADNGSGGNGKGGNGAARTGSNGDRREGAA
jgi:glycosyltransferase involved in cell wall biosynthesis